MKFGLLNPRNGRFGSPYGPFWTAICCAATIAAGVFAVIATGPPSALDSSASAEKFSAERALGTVERIAQKPRPLGSVESDIVRDYLVDTLTEYGLRTEVQSRLGATTSEDGEVRVAQVDNVVATLEGTDSSGTVLMVAHYDSVAAGPGAGDNGAAVGGLIETARALASSAPARNDITFVLTDGEEVGLLGADAYVREHLPPEAPVVVTNWEGRGTSGPSQLFETSNNNAALIALYADSVEYPSGDSSLVETYRQLPHDTDLSKFLDADVSGLNFAFSGSAENYHGPGDSISNLSGDTVQHHGENMIGLARGLGAVDLSAFEQDSQTGGDATYFGLPGTFVVYSNSLVLPLAVTGLLVAIAVAVVARKKQSSTVRGLVMATVTLPGVALIAAVLGWTAWTVMEFGPGVSESKGFLRNAVLAELAVLAIGLVPVVLWVWLLRRSVTACAAGVSGLLWLAIIGVGSALYEPGSAYQNTVPALALGVTTLLSFFVRPAVGLVFRALGALVLAVIAAPVFVYSLRQFGLGGAAFSASLAVFFVAPLLILFVNRRSPPAVRATREDGHEPMRSTTSFAPAIGAATLALGTVMLLVVTVAVNRPTAAAPVPMDLSYLVDSDTGQAFWLSRDDEVPELPKVAMAAVSDKDIVFRNWPGTPPIWAAGAPVDPVAAPRSELILESDGRRSLSMQSMRGAPVVGVRGDVLVDELEIEVAGFDPIRVDLDDSPLDLWVGDSGSENVVVKFMTARDEPLSLQVYDVTHGLGGFPEWNSRPAEIGGSTWADGNSVVVTDRVHS